ERAHGGKVFFFLEVRGDLGNACRNRVAFDECHLHQGINCLLLQVGRLSEDDSDVFSGYRIHKLDRAVFPKNDEPEMAAVLTRNVHELRNRWVYRVWWHDDRLRQLEDKAIELPASVR